MKTLFTAAAAAAFIAGGALAQEPQISFIELDANEDGQLSHGELHAVAPDVTEDEFASYDADADGYLQEPEFDTWLAVYAGSENDDPGGDDGDDPVKR
jgi:Ca2+-binding EF-hand superfamily protein